ncbi:dihydrolipoyllysine-residue acetyltransferase component of pyruvate dehydrogenase complex, partial [Striga asiatica]
MARLGIRDAREFEAPNLSNSDFAGRARRIYNEMKSKGLTMMVLLAQETALVLAEHPVVNFIAREIVVATDGGLITPVLQDAKLTYNRHRDIGRNWLIRHDQSSSNLMSPIHEMMLAVPKIR